MTIPGNLHHCITYLDEDGDRIMTFNSDSYLIAVDNCASHCMTNKRSDFVGYTMLVQVNVMGVGQTQAMEMLLWVIKDDNGTAHEEFIPNSYLVPQLPVRLL
jgi:hypothetical protein